jgi:hypothetical protein
MKRLFSLLLILSFILSGCSLGREPFIEPVTFYYLKDHSGKENYDAFFVEGAIGSEIRESSGHRYDLNYLAALYLQGPTDQQLRSPFPAGSKVLDIQLDDGILHITMNTISSRFNDMDLTIGCACLSRTFMELTQVETVHVASYSSEQKLLFSRTFTADNMILEDLYTPIPETTEATQ